MISKAKKCFIKVKKDVAWSRIFTLIIVMIIIAGSSVPGNNIPRIFTLTPDKLIHCLEYAVLGIFIFHWLRLEYHSYPLYKISLATFFLGSLIGVIDENYQRLIPGRYTDFWDWVLDSSGVLLAIIMINYLVKKISSNKKGSSQSPFFQIIILILFNLCL